MITEQRKVINKRDHLHAVKNVTINVLKYHLIRLF